MEKTFIEVRGLKNKKATINLRYLKRFEENASGTTLYVDNGDGEVYYNSTIPYTSLQALIKDAMISY